jgi:hypothetical protein
VKRVSRTNRESTMLISTPRFDVVLSRGPSSARSVRCRIHIGYLSITPLMNSIIYPFPSCPLPSLLLLRCLNNRAISTSYLIDGYGPYIFYQGNFYILIHNDFSRACLIVPYRQFPSECLMKHRIISALGAVSPYNRMSF